MGSIFSKPEAAEAATPAATPAPAVEGASKSEPNEGTKKKKRNSKSSLMVSNTTTGGSGSVGTGINL